MTTNIQTSTMESSNQSNQHAQSWLPSKGNVLFTLCAIGVAMATLLYALSTGVIQVAATSLNQPAANAPSTSIIPYQGRLSDADGNPLTATVDMHFRLYDTAEGGTPLWAEAWSDTNGVQVSDGMFNVMLGSMTPISETVMSENSSLFLGLAAGDDDEMTPRVQLGSVPFAMQGSRVPDGSITTEKLAYDVQVEPADGSITAAKLAPNLFQVHSTSQSTNRWDYKSCSTNGSPLIPGLTIDFTIDEPRTALIDVAGLGLNTQSGQAIYSKIKINDEFVTTDGGNVVYGGCRNSPTDSGSYPFCSLANTATIELEPGTHNISTYASCSGTGTVMIWSSNLRVLLLPR
ncbi:MAG: hypothetical protein AAF639_05810 [Chloroflexota bacterium]